MFEVKVAEKKAMILINERWQRAFDALRAAGLEANADHPIAVAYRAASDAVNHANRSRDFNIATGMEVVGHSMSSYYNRPWRGAVEVAYATDGTGPWRVLQSPIISVEDGNRILGEYSCFGQCCLVGRAWRIVDVGGNVYESGWIDADGCARNREGYLVK
jgi:hypothetical protein